LRCVAVSCCSESWCSATSDNPYVAQPICRDMILCCSTLSQLVVAECCSVLQCVAVCCSALLQRVTGQHKERELYVVKTPCRGMTVCYSALLQYVVAVRCCSTLLQSVAECCFDLQRDVAVRCCSALLQCVVAVRCCIALLQCVVECCYNLQRDVAAHCCSALLQRVVAECCRVFLRLAARCCSALLQ